LDLKEYFIIDVSLDKEVPVLQQLHGLPVHQCVQCKITVLVYKALHKLPVYLAEDCQLMSVTGRRQLCS